MSNLKNYIKRNGMPTAYVISHTRYDDTLFFGPFFKYKECLAWLKDNPDVMGVIIPVHKNVNWKRGK